MFAHLRYPLVCCYEIIPFFNTTPAHYPVSWRPITKMNMEVENHSALNNQWMSSEQSVHTVFLPRRLPDCADDLTNDGGCTFGETNAIMAFTSINKKILPDRIIRMLDLWNSHFRLNSERLLALLETKLLSGDTFPIHLPAQNAALTLTRNDNETFTIRGFNVQAAASVVMADSGSLVTSQPRASVCIPNKYVLDPSLADQLAKLQKCVFPDAEAKTQRRHTELIETREVISPKYVFKWLFGLLSVLDDDSDVLPATKAITKKVRDRVMFKKSHSADAPWRRHPSWLAFKFILHATLVIEHSYAMGTVMYKAAMLNFMTAFLDFKQHTSQHDLCQQMMAKIACRLSKLKVLVDKYADDLNQTTTTGARAVIGKSTVALEKCSHHRNNAWRDMIMESENLRILPDIPQIVPAPSVTLALTASKNAIEKALSSTASVNKVTPGVMEKHASANDVFSPTGLTREGAVIGLHLWEERVFKAWLKMVEWNTFAISGVKEMLGQYDSASSRYYRQSDPIGQSRRLLTSTALIGLCDMAITQCQPLLLQHKPGVDTEVLEGLLATDALQLRVIQSLETYFQRRNNEATMDGPLVKDVSSSSLSVHYAGQQPAMKQCLRKMLEEDEQKREDHKQRVRTHLNNMEHDEQRLRNMTCTETTVTSRRYNSRWGEYENYTETRHPNCSWCPLNRDLANRQESIFERCLPDDQDMRLAVIFEYQLPEDIRHWRDSIYDYTSIFLQALGSKSTSCRKLWIHHLRQSTTDPPTVTLGSTNISFLDAHYRQLKSRSHRCLDDYFKPCNLNCELATKDYIIHSPHCNLPTHRDHCTFKVDTHCSKSLQSFVTYTGSNPQGTTGQDQSKVIAQQGSCPEFFSPREFVSYGSVRCGERLQWHSILRGIHDRSLVLHQLEVVQLICQCVWQAGSNQIGTVLRESHHVLGRSPFVQEFTAELDHVLESIRGNWQHNWALCSIVVLANRILNVLQHEEECAAAAGNVAALQRVLVKCRQVAMLWLDQIQLLQQGSSFEDSGDLQMDAARVATFGALTYECGAMLDQDAKPLHHWLRFVTDMNSNTVLNGSRPTGFLEILFDCVLRVGVRRHADFYSLLQQDSTHFPDLMEFITKFYCPGSQILSYKLHAEDQLWVQFTWRANHGKDENIQIDLRQGRCWINGLPHGRLPSSITNSECKLFERHFGHNVFTVSPCTSPQDKLAQTSKIINNCGPFIFSTMNGSGEQAVTIYETHSSGRRLLLLPHIWFSNGQEYDIPAHLVNEHSMWIDLETHEIFLRPVSFQHPDFADLDNCNYVLDFNSRCMTVRHGAAVGVAQGSSLIRLSTDVGECLVKIFRRLELTKYTEIWLRPDGSVYVRLPRLGLAFFLSPKDEALALRSMDHNGWCVDVSQSLGTLIGLRDGLVLVKYANTQYSQRCLLLPQAPVSVHASHANHHQTVSVNLDDKVGSPAMFRYYINTNLQQIQAPASRAAWFYLAYLHGMTSSVLPDPLTCMTGTEMAMVILQSARSWSNSPYDTYSKMWLHRISHLSPRRDYYPRHLTVMEIVTWPEGIPSMCASDSYAILIDQLLKYSRKLPFLFPAMLGPNEDESQGMSGSVSKLQPRELNKMEYLRSLEAYPVLARLEGVNSPSAKSETDAFPEDLKPSPAVQRTGDCVLLRNSKFGDVSVQEIEQSLLDSGSTDQTAFSTLGVQQLLCCDQWRDVDVRSAFMSFQECIEELRESRKLLLALVLSYWVFTEKKSSTLLNLAVAMCSLESVVRHPLLQQYPYRRHDMPSASTIFYKFRITAEQYTRKHGLVDLSSWESNSSVIEAHRSKRQRLYDQYNEQERRMKQQLEIIVSTIKGHLENGPIGYNETPPTLPPVPLSQLTADIMDATQCKTYVMDQFQRSNASLVLLQYAQRLCDAVGEVNNYEQRSIRDIFVSGAGVLARHSQYTYGHIYDVRDVESEVFNRLVAIYSGGVSKKLTSLHDTLRSLKDPISKDFATDLRQSCKALECEGAGNHPTLTEAETSEQSITHALQQTVQDKAGAVKFIADSLAEGSHEFRALSACGLTHRSSALALLPAVLEANKSRSEPIPGLVHYSFSTRMHTAIGGLAVQLVKMQRSARLARLRSDGQMDYFQRELMYVPHATWQPLEHVEWLLFEVENDLTIWPKQVSVAEKMMSDDGEYHVVVQLNMGEGKTSVILPVIAAALADGQSLVRVVVLTSLYATNHQQLIFKLGGILGHRVFSLPFSRSVALTQGSASQMTSFINDCRRRRDVMVTVREHLLSQLLKYEEACCKPDLPLAQELRKLVTTLQQYARDVLDEADEILHHRFQLVYPIGPQQKPDGGEKRWLMAEVILEAVKTHAEELSEIFPQTVAYNRSAQRQAFPHLRILESQDQDKAYHWLREKVVEFILAGKGKILDSDLMDGLSLVLQTDAGGVKLKNFLVSPQLTDDDITWFSMPELEKIAPYLLCIRGFLASGVLLLALKKRFRVEYGLPSMAMGASAAKLRQGERLISMAVPFRAKDIVAERTEFGHTDVAVILTLLSYYQYGLTGQQVDVLLKRLDREEAKVDVYNSWVAAAHIEHVDSSIREYVGINNKDATQKKTMVIPFLTRHTEAVNFYLNHITFPNEANEFQNKLLVNSWSITPVERRLKVTGFSGTNDTRHLLPGSTKQDDLPQLKHTNAFVCDLVCGDENNKYAVLDYQPMTGENIITDIVAMTPPINTIIDAGALVLDLTNEKFALLWLKKRLDKKGVVFFDGENQLRVMSRQHRVSCKLELSAFADDLSECLVYLDHAHCRGTDLRMVKGTVAAVTLGKGLRRDELVQACMRMRRLGKGHTLTFWAPREVDRLIHEKCNVKKGDHVTNCHVVQWCFLNSISATKDGFYSWATQGLAYLRSGPSLFGAVDRLSGNGKTAEEDMDCQELANTFLFPDCKPLKEMYGQVRHEVPIPDIIERLSGGTAAGKNLVKKCRHFVPDVHRYAQALDEEQEREMEKEEETEEERDLPPIIDHVPETCPQYLIELAKTGELPKTFPDTQPPIPLWKCFQSTSLWAHYKEFLTSSGFDSRHLLASESFSRVVQNVPVLYGKPSVTDKYLRPVHWLLYVRGSRSEDDALLALSPFEANTLALLDLTGKWHSKVSLLIYSSPMQPQQGIMADLPCTVAGNRLQRLHQASRRIQCYFAEIFLFSGGLFYGAHEEDQLSMMESLASLLHLIPGPQDKSGLQVCFDPKAYATHQDHEAHIHHNGDRRTFPSDPVLFLRELMDTLRSRDSLKLSHTGSLLLRHSWCINSSDNAASEGVAAACSSSHPSDSTSETELTTRRGSFDSTLW